MSVVKERNLQKLLYICNYPPCDLAGACVIMKQVFSRYEPSRISVLCDGQWLASAKKKCGSSLLACEHTAVACRFPVDWRPRRFWGRLRQVLNLRRVEKLVALGSEIISARGVEGVFAPFHDPEFAIAAYKLHRQFGIPLYVWESDEWPAMYRGVPFVETAAQLHHEKILRAARVVWMTSPSMIDKYREQFGIEGRFLFNFVDTRRFGSSSRTSDEHRDSWTLTYTGAINGMFEETLFRISGWLNAGVAISGRPVKMKIYSTCDCGRFVGRNVSHEGFVAHSQIPDVLAQADALLVAVSLSGNKEIVQLIETSLYTKTIEYLASRRPVLYVGPENSAENRYFGEVMAQVFTSDKQRFVDELGKVLVDAGYRSSLSERGFSFVQERHSFDALERDIFGRFAAK